MGEVKRKLDKGDLVGQVLGLHTPDMPELPEVKEAPTPDDAGAKAERQRKAQRRYKGKGRAGTILSMRSGLG